MKKRLPAFVWLALGTASMSPLFAQTIKSSDSTTNTTTVPAIHMDATVRAKRLRFETNPRINVNAGNWTSERENLPDTIEPGREYRNIKVHTTLETPLLIETNDVISPIIPQETDTTTK